MPWCPTSPSCAPRAPSSRLRPHRSGPWGPERIRLGAGLSAAEAHSHTLASDGMVTAVELVRAAAAIGLSVICITDHDTLSPLEEATEVGAKLGIEVVAGEEVTCAFPPGIHVVALFVDRAIRMHMPVEDTVDAIHDAGGLAVVAHPFMPTDPYSHTPSFAGAQQPGMTGQVKEDLIARLGEMGVALEGGRLAF